MDGQTGAAPLTRAYFEALDRADPLRRFQDAFALPTGVIYLDGNSLGPLPRATPARVAEVVEREWGAGLIRSWNDAGWIDLAGVVAGKIARLIGAAPESVVVGDSTSVNLFKLLAAALDLRPDRRVILSERENFPTDLYIAEGLIALLGRGHTLRLVAADEMAAAMADDVAVVMLTHVNYRTGRMHDMAALTEAAHRAGALVLWDLAHSAGAVPLDLAGCEVDLAVGCGYKYLNGGPGAPAFLHVAPRLQPGLRLPLTGWLGHAAPFAFETGYRPADGIARAVVGTPPILSLAALDVGIDLALEAPMAEVRDKSLLLGTLFANLVARHCTGHGLVQVSPDAPERRGSQVCFAHPHAYALMQALIEAGVIGDFRAPDILRFGLTPLTLPYAAIWDAAQVLSTSLERGVWREARFQVPRKVT